MKTLKQDIAKFCLTFDKPQESNASALYFTAHQENENPIFPHKFTIKLAKKFKPNASQCSHFPIQRTSPSQFHSSGNEVSFPSTHLNSTFSFLQI